MLTRFIVVLCLWLCVSAAAAPDIFLKLADENDNDQQNDWHMTQQQDSIENHEYFRSDLLRKALDILHKKKNDLKSDAIHKCIYKHHGLRNRLNCVKELINKTKLIRKGLTNNQKINRMKDYSNEYDYYEFQDLTKSDIGRSFKNKYNFSQDYLDVNDLLRTNKKPDNKETKKRYVFKIIQPKHNKYNRFDYDLTRFRKNDIGRKFIRDNYDDDSSESDSTQDDTKREKTQKYETFDKTIEIDTDSDELSSSEEDAPIPKQKRTNPLILYMQSPSRVYEDTRRRLPHFLPKRYHWDEDEIKDLSNYWFNGPQGKYSGLYKTPY